MQDADFIMLQFILFMFFLFKGHDHKMAQFFTTYILQVVVCIDPSFSEQKSKLWAFAVKLPLNGHLWFNKLVYGWKKIRPYLTLGLQLVQRC